MATIEPLTIHTKDGRMLTLRSAASADAPALAEYLRHVDLTSAHGVREPGEWKSTPDEVAADVKSLADAPRSLMLLATDAGRIVGELSFKGHKHSRLAHHGHIGLSVHADWRGRGVGAAMIAALLDWAAGHPTIEKVCLGVYATNEPAIALYKKMGFAEECRRHREFRLASGEYVDDIQMSVWVKRV